MSQSTGEEKRAFIRVTQSLPVRYKFVGADSEDRAVQQAYNGETKNLSGRGMLLVGKLPNPAWVQQLLDKKIAVAVSVRMPGMGGPLKAVARVAWISVNMEAKPAQCEMGLEFNEITHEDEQRLLEFIISSLV